MEIKNEILEEKLDNLIDVEKPKNQLDQEYSDPKTQDIQEQKSSKKTLKNLQFRDPQNLEDALLVVSTISIFLDFWIARTEKLGILSTHHKIRRRETLECYC